jgi:RNA polymerase sigma-70 factor (ECF subfamily)
VGTTDEPKSEGTILAAILAGDGDSFDELMRRYQRPLWRVARSRLGRDDWADDVVQETFCCVLRWLHTYDSRFSFRTWLWTILLNQCRRQLKKCSRGYFLGWWQEEGSDNPLHREIARQLELDETPSKKLVAKERTELLDALLIRLPEVQADALRLRFFGGLKFSEIADTMSCSLSTAKNRVKWGLLKLADLVGPSGECASWALALGDVQHEERD